MGKQPPKPWPVEPAAHSAMTDQRTPRTAAGRAHLSTFVSNQHRNSVDAAYECQSDIDRCDICAQESDDILAIETEAVALDVERLAVEMWNERPALGRDLGGQYHRVRYTQAAKRIVARLAAEEEG